jgi:hypothetical protein
MDKHRRRFDRPACLGESAYGLSVDRRQVSLPAGCDEARSMEDNIASTKGIPPAGGILE